MGKKQEKTNAVRILESKGIGYEYFEYDETVTEGTKVAELLGEPYERVFKTLVTVSAKNINYVFVIPVHKSLDLKAAAAAVGEKSVSMIKQKDLFPLTGYIHGGCSPIGMKKLFKTLIDSSAAELDFFYVSAGRVGRQIKISPKDVVSITGASFGKIADSDKQI